MRRDAKQKVLLLLLGGVALGLSKSPKGYFKILKSLSENWRQIKKERLYRIVHEFYNDRLVDYKEDKDGFVKIILTKQGQKKALKFKLDEMEIKKPAKWDGEWRIVIFDIPEKLKKVREALRYHLKRLGFKKLQHSVFVLPFECRNEIEYIVEFYNIRHFVRYIEAHHIDNELDLKHKFHLL